MLLLLRSCTKHITRSYVTPPQRYHQGLLIHASDTICFIIIAIIFSSSLSIYVTFFQTWHLLQKFRGDKIRVKRVWWVLSANFTPGWFGIGIRYCPDGDQFIDILPILSAWPWDSRRLVQGGKVPFALSFCAWLYFFLFSLAEYTFTASLQVLQQWPLDLWSAAQVGLWTVTRQIGIPRKCTQTLGKGSAVQLSQKIWTHTWVGISLCWTTATDW